MKPRRNTQNYNSGLRILSSNCGSAWLVVLTGNLGTGTHSPPLRVNTVKRHSQAVPQRGSVRNPLVPSLFTLTCFRSSTRSRLPLQFALIVNNGGAHEILQSPLINRIALE